MPPMKPSLLAFDVAVSAAALTPRQVCAAAPASLAPASFGAVAAVVCVPARFPRPGVAARKPR